MGFIPDIERICKLLPFTRQTLFFSATMPSEIQRLADSFLHRPERIEIAPQSTAAATIVQRLKKAPDDAAGKRDALRALLRESNVKNAIIFCNRKKDVGILLRSLLRHGFNAGGLHGDMDQHQRTATLDAFRNGSIAFLAASDVAARGLDIPDVSHIFNYDVPIHPEDYIHRIGRTGRAGREGFAATLVTPKDIKALKAIERMLHQEIPWIDGAQSDAEAGGETEERHRGNGHRRGARAKRHKGPFLQAKPAIQAAPHKDHSSEGRNEAQAKQPPRHEPPQTQAHAKPTQHAPRAQHAPHVQHGLHAQHGSQTKASHQSRPPHLPPAKSQSTTPQGRPQAKPAQQPQPHRSGVRGMGEHVPAFMTRSVRPLD
jgi:superfamily II DNA/RNA helicase